MEYQAYYGTLMSQCIDILYEAFSNMLENQICLTCMILYSLPAPNKMPSEDLNNEDLNG
jgi:hypothetical protein